MIDDGSASPLYEDTEGAQDAEELTASATLQTFKKWFKIDKEHSSEWRDQAVEDFAFAAGEQWTDAEKKHLKDNLRPLITFNRIEPLLRSVSGTEVTNRQEVRYLPREEGDNGPDELLTGAAEWFRDEAESEDEESDAFLDAATCGMGWVESRLDLESDPSEPMPLDERIDPIEMFWDASSRRRNLVDATRIWRVRKIGKADAKLMFPDADPVLLDAKWTELPENGKRISDREESLKYEGSGQDDDDDDDGKVTVVQVQWSERKEFYKVADPTTGQAIELSPDKHSTLQKRAKQMGMSIQSVRLFKKVYFQAFLGKEILQVKPNSCPNEFTMQCITGFRDRNSGTWYGLVRQMKDPQRWANKWLSQVMHIMNADAKGGLIAEKGVADDDRQFEQSYAKTDTITWVKPGSLSNANGPRYARKETATFPAGFFQLMEFAVSSVRDVTGINLEMLGMREGDQAASLEYQRRQAGMTILATLFDSLRRYRKRQGRVMLYFIQNHLSDGRLVRIVGQGGAKYAPLALKQDMKYDIIVDDSPSSPNQKEMIWAQMQPILPILGKLASDGTVPPAAMFEVLKYALPASVADKLDNMMKQQAEDPSTQHAGELKKQMAELQVQVTAMDAKLKSAQADKAMADAMVAQSQVGQGPNGDAEAAKVLLDHQAKQAEMSANIQFQRDKALADVTHQHMKSQGEIALQREKMAGDAQHQVLKASMDAQLAGQKAVLDARTKIATAKIAADAKPKTQPKRTN